MVRHSASTTKRLRRANRAIDMEIKVASREREFQLKEHREPGVNFANLDEARFVLDEKVLTNQVEILEIRIHRSQPRAGRENRLERRVGQSNHREPCECVATVACRRKRRISINPFGLLPRKRTIHPPPHPHESHAWQTNLRVHCSMRRMR